MVMQGPTGSGSSWYDRSHSFANIPKAEIQRSKFDRSHGIKTTFDAGWLVPIFADEMVPGDTFSVSGRLFGRLSTPQRPVMDNMFLDTQFFFVPLRLVWTNFKRFMGEQTDPGDSTSYLVPTMTSPAVTGHAVMSLSDHLGIPPEVPLLEHSSLFHRAYALIYNEWYRDQNLVDSAHLDLGDGPDLPANYPLQRRGKRKDYFTSCLPWPAKEAAVSLPLGDVAPVVPTTAGQPDFTIGAGTHAIQSDGSTTNMQWGGGTPTGPTIATWNTTGLETDLSAATGATINALRLSIQLQRLYERDARGGTRYTEIVRSHFGVTSPDARLQRPEYLGGGSQVINVTTVPKTSQDGAAPVGFTGGLATTDGGGHSFTYSATEHGIVLGIASLRADLNYQQGLHRMFSRSTRWDFYWPALAHIGEQAVLSKEIFADASAGDDLVFGYQERFSEYRYKPNQITGLFRSQVTGAIDFWHVAEEFSPRPVLDKAFIEVDPPIDRVIVVSSEPHLIVDGWFQFTAARPMPTYSVPGLMDHF